MQYLQSRDGPDTFLGKCPMIIPSFPTATALPVCSIPWFSFTCKNFINSYFPHLFIYVVAVNSASSFDSTVFHAFLTCFVLVYELGSKAITLSELTYSEKIFAGTPNHKNIFTQKFCNTKISRCTVVYVILKHHLISVVPCGSVYDLFKHILKIDIHQFPSVDQTSTHFLYTSIN